MLLKEFIETIKDAMQELLLILEVRIKRGASHIGFFQNLSYRDTLREYLWNYLLTHPCAQCGETDPVVLEFHYIGGKDMPISEMITRISSVDRLKEELQKRWRYLRIVIGG